MIDHSVYPDVEHGEEFEDDYDRADYVQRICAACDFGVPPDRDTVALFRGWRDVFDRFPSPTRRRITRCARTFAGQPCRSSRASIRRRGKRWTRSRAATIPVETSFSRPLHSSGSRFAMSWFAECLPRS